jgi:glycosyltransferase involved in cell wall biosynthesis
MDDVHLPGHVTPPARTAYYRVARVLVSASEHEGFGLPMVEAMHHGVPVVARGAAAVGETVGDGGLVVGPGSIERFAEVVAMAAEPGDLRTRLIEAGQRRVEAFAPARVAAELTTAVAEALAR